ncbi:general negative regulator of transcription subunit 3 isoform X1 [Abrus precatorius]|uniref:General negative regulator of transcription subunit 3 isoform X1 n=1 Tax=Abrus precatorius TaxID=3816 RepID=A0A8B8LDN9_ABRPR|nr:general negative regulator of transcription subunit 3 isoform X1 [Abrus precatorius]XP_027353419.1 general negative regulator of transcription subunit 3 isoform X1 [Abrus precatorius]
MGASRKLQGEIDRVLKKVQEGVEVFDSIWNKVYDTDNANQKEKFEADLKKEIKKLQRYRDQIKTWIQSSEIKDKKVSASYEQALVDARKLIEREMERFKICEKETKTKAFSKEGLGQQPKTDPKEKAKSETRDWLNNVVGELESQIDNFEAELEGLSVKKGKSRPPRLTHLETSITRHKAHIKKCEFILRLLDNDELSPEQVNDVKDFLDDYVERNQEDFDEFSDVDELYSSLPLDKVDTLEDLVTIPAALSKVAPGLSLKSSPAPSASASASASQSSETMISNYQDTYVQEQADDTASLDSNSDIAAKTPPSKSVGISSAPSTPAGNHATPVSVNVSGPNVPSVPAVAVLPGSNSLRNVENTNVTNSSSVNPSTSTKDEEINSFPSRRPSPSLSDATLVRGRNGLSNQATASIPLGSGNMVSTNGGLGSVPLVSEITKRNMLGADDRLGSSGMVQPLVSPLSNRLILPQAVKANDGTVSVDSSTVNEAAAVSGRVFSPSVVPGMQWRPGSPFQNQNDAGQLRGRTEIAPDQREKFLQKYQQVQQGHSTLLNMPSLVGGNHKQFSSQQQNPLLQQFNSQGSSVSSQSGIGLGVQSTNLSGISSASLQQPNSVHSSSSQQPLMPGVPKDADVGNSKIEEQQQHQNFPDESTTESTASTGTVKNLINEDDSKSTYAVDFPAGVSASLPESAQTSRDIDLSPGQPLQSNQATGNLGVIGRRNGPELGAIGDNFSGSSVSSGGVRDQFFNLQMLEAAHFKIPQSKDSERPRTYTPRHPAITPPSYPQVQAPIVNNPAFWERLGLEPFGTDTMFFAFYYQQNTYQQYLAAKELKKQSWRYHRKYNTWFQRHEEPKVATDEYEQGTYVYFDFHIANDDMQHGWCQRIKTEFTFEYNYLEDEVLS